MEKTEYSISPSEFYEKYFLVNGQKPPKLSQAQKEFLDGACKKGDITPPSPPTRWKEWKFIAMVMYIYKEDFKVPIKQNGTEDNK